jgi:hypothetical protein
MVSREEVEACRNELLELKSQVQTVQEDYKTMAKKRVSQQTKMARMVQLVNDRCMTKDVPLVEDVIVISLQTETTARCDDPPVAPPPIDPACQPHGRQTASAEEAWQIYQQQIATLQMERQYRAAMLQLETKMVGIYGQGIADVCDTVKTYGRSQVVDEILKMVEPI